MDAWNQTDRNSIAVAQQSSVLATLAANPDQMTPTAKAAALSFIVDLIQYLDQSDNTTVNGILSTLGECATVSV